MDAEKMVNFQLQMRENQEELNDFVSGLGTWAKEMNTKEQELRKSHKDADSGRDPPVRNSLLKKKRKKVKKPHTSEAADSTGKSSSSKKINAYDYRAWDRFDVDSALAEVDKEKAKEDFDEETDEEWEEERRALLAQQEKEKGNAHFKAGRWDDAVECYSTAVRLEPTNPVLYTNRAMAQLRAERFAAAEVDCSEALQLEPTSTKALYRRGLARKELGPGRAPQALADFEAVLKLDPQNKAALSEAAALEKIVRPTGEVKAVHKEPSARSKKPLKRITIEQVGVSSDQVAARKVEPALADFLKKRSSDSDALPVTSESPDIPKTEPPPEVKRTDTNSSPAAEPVPKTFAQFGRSFASLRYRGGPGLTPFLLSIPPASYAALFGQCLEPVHLNALLLALCQAEDSHAAAGLRALWGTPRFGFLAMMIGSGEREQLRRLRLRLMSAEAISAAEGQRLAEDYRL